MTGAKTATASFTLNQYELVVSAGTGGTVKQAPMIMEVWQV